MKLLYMYIESFGDLFQDISFNFSNEYLVHYDKESQVLAIKNNPQYLDTFYGEVLSELTAIVGKNGTGKTTILELIGRTMKDRLELANVSNGELKDKYFMIYHADEDTFYCEGVGLVAFENITGYKNLLSGERAIARSFYFHKDTLDSFILNQSYESRVRDRIIYIRDDVIKSSSGSQVYLGSGKIKFIPRVTGALFSWTDWYRVYLDLYSKKIIQTSKIQLVFKPSNEVKKSSENNNFFIPSIRPAGDPTLNGMILLVEEWMDDFFSRLMSLLINYIIDLCETVCYPEFENELNVWVLQNRNKSHYTLSEYEDIFNKLIIIIKGRRSEATEAELVIKFIELTSAFFSAIYEAQNEIIPGIDEFQISISGIERNENVFKFLKCYTALQQFINYHFSETKDKEGLEINESLGERYSAHLINISMPTRVERVRVSTGEKKLLELISTIIYEVNESTVMQPFGALNLKIKKNHIVLVDEIEAAMHLDWSRNLLEYIISYLEELTFEINGEDKKYTEFRFHVQLIMTTHSPFLLSDLHRNSIIALESVNQQAYKKSYISAFAQNIQRIMNNEFFIKDSFGVFAQKKINEIIDQCNKEQPFDEVEKRRIRLTIDEVGEPVLRKKLEEKFIKKLKKDSDISYEELELVSKFKQLFGEKVSLEQGMERLKKVLGNQEK